jgi:hypothetical protein
LLIKQRKYALTLSGIRLCVTIIESDQIEYKYTKAYLEHDSSAVRHILNAIKWLLSPFLTLKSAWEKENNHSE